MLMRLKGVHTTKKRMADGTSRVYYYAWRGGPRMKAKVGTADFQAEFARHIADKARHDVASVGGIIDEYLVSSEFAGSSPDHVKATRRYLELIRGEFGTMPLAALERPRVKGLFRAFRDNFQATPRKADYVWSTLSRLMSFAVERGHISVSPCIGAKRLYEADRTDAVWDEADIAAFYEKASKPLSRALMLALWTGQRQGDLLRLTWSAYDGKTLRLKQSKGKTRVPVPLGQPIRDMLDAMKAEREGRIRDAQANGEKTVEALQILTNSRKQPWTSDGFRTSWEKAAKKAGVTNLHFHDLRGTAVTRLALSGATVPEIASITGHSLKTVQDILDKHYLGGRLELAEAGVKKLDAVYGTSTKATNRV